jgi:hypothetical protein
MLVGADVDGCGNSSTFRPVQEREGDGAPEGRGASSLEETFWTGAVRNRCAILVAISLLLVRESPGARGWFPSLSPYHKWFSFQEITKIATRQLFLGFCSRTLL